MATIQQTNDGCSVSDDLGVLTFYYRDEVAVAVLPQFDPALRSFMFDKDLVRFPAMCAVKWSGELSARAALLALESDMANTGHLANLYVLADLVERIGGELYVSHHAATIKRLCDQIHGDAYHCGHLTYMAMRASADVLLRWVLVQKNGDISRHARQAVRELAA